MGNWIIADPSSRLPALSRLFCTPCEIAMQVPVKLRISSCNYPLRTLGINSAGSNWQTQSYLAYYSPLAAAWNWVAHRLSLFYPYNPDEDLRDRSWPVRSMVPAVGLQVQSLAGGRINP